MRLAFRAVGQTELQRWLADLSSKDGVPPLTREAPPEPTATTVGPLRGADGQESGLMLNLDDAEEVRPPARARARGRGSDRPPPPPAAATDVMTRPPQFAPQDRRWTERREVRIGGAVLIAVLLVFAVKAMSGDKKAEPPRQAPAAAVTPPAPTAPAPPATAPAPPMPAPAAATPPPEAAPAVPPKVAAVPPAEAPPADDNNKAAPAENPAPDEKDEPSKADPAAKPKRPPLPVTIKSDPDGSSVATGKHVFGKTPLTLKLRPGNSYEFTFAKPGYTTLSRKFRFDGDEPQSVRVTLKRIPEPPHKASPPPPPPVVRGPPPVPPKRSFFTR
jgi:hypothetical protein